MMRVRCDHKHRHDMSDRLKSYTQQEAQTESIDEATVRGLLTDFTKRYSRRTGCHKTTSWINVMEDIPELLLRRPSLLLSEDGYMPDDRMCSHCGWISGSGVTTTEYGVQVFYCYNEECAVALRKRSSEIVAERIEEQKQQGLCIYNDYHAFPATRGYCTNVSDGEDHLCAEHRGRRCEECRRQATYTYWEYGSLAYSHFRCREH